MALQEKEFVEFFHKVYIAHTQFCVWLHLNNEIAKPSQHDVVKSDLFWKIVLPTFQHAWILALSRVVVDARYHDMRKKKKPRLSLDYIISQIDDPVLSASIRNVHQKHYPAIESLKYHRRFIAHNPLGEIQRSEVAAVGPLFDDLEKIIIAIGKHVGHGFIENSLYMDYDTDLMRRNTDEVARSSAERLLQAIVHYFEKGKENHKNLQ